MYIYNAKEHYESQMENIEDLILLGNTRLEKTTEVSRDWFYLQDLTKLRWLTSLSEHHGEVVAGSYMSAAVNKSIRYNDIDVYFYSKEHANLWCKINYISIPEYVFDLCATVYRKGVKINLIIGIPFNSVEDLISSFDIRACAIAYVPETNKIIEVEGALDDCKHKRIIFQTGAKYITVKRLVKYLDKGFSIDEYQQVIFSELIRFKPNRDLEILEYKTILGGSSDDSSGY